ncbi:TetR family transcriptional regulator [Salinispira pacifica]
MSDGGKRAALDPRVSRTRRLIEEAFLAVMEEKGFEELSVNDVTDRAGINRATFYSHFVDKYSLLGHTVRTSFLEEVEGNGLERRELAPDSVRDLFLTVCGYVTALHEHCKPPHVHLDWILEAQITDVSAELFNRWAVSSGRKGTKAFELAAVAASSAMYGLVLRWSRQKRRPAASSFVHSSLSIVTGILGLGSRQVDQTGDLT